ncbi:neprilysin-1-like [Ornithodoros turicata]|uniref:neprilysin-1-like n=1 Tax=Ornithodoros turicata TaxID=34597 RepID=UPI003139E895
MSLFDIASLSGRLLKKAINTTVKPCDDFYGHVCGTWIENSTNLPGGAKYQNAQESFWKQLKGLLEDVQDSHKEKPKYLKKATQAYQICLKGAVGEAQKDELKELLSGMGIEEWPITSEDDISQPWDDLFVKAHNQFGLTAVMKIQVEPDRKNSTLHAITLRAPSFGFGDYIWHLSREEQRQLWTKYREYIRNFMKKYEPSLEENQINTTVEDIVKFEKLLFQAFAPYWNDVDGPKVKKPGKKKKSSVKQKRSVRSDPPKTVGELQGKIPQVSI